VPRNRDNNDSDDSGGHGGPGKTNRDDQNDENKLKLLEPRGSDKIELFDYLTNTMSLEILNQKEYKEVRMFQINGTIHANPKFLTVRATK